jgi:CubicO group peptidase (beta-lactamase class C family)
VVLDGETFYEQGYGVKLQDTSQSVNSRTIFRIGPITQQMTAAAVLQQVELGRVGLDDPVTELIPELQVAGPWPAERITVWHVLTNTSGFPDVIEAGEAQNEGSLAAWAARQDDLRLFAPPGSMWNYSNPNFMIAGLIAERAAGVSYRPLIEDELWARAGMDRTTFDPAEVRANGNFAHGHCWVCSAGGVVSVEPEENDLWDVGPAGMAFSTVGDLTAWALLLMDGGGPVLSRWSASTIQDRHQWMHHTPDQYAGFGITNEDYRGLDVRQYIGSVRGYGAHLLWVPERRFAVALLANATSTLSRAAECIVDAVLEPEEVDDQDLTTDPATWTKYLGTYAMTESNGYQTNMKVYLDGDRLMGSVTDPAVPSVAYVAELVQSYLDTFRYDTNGDGTPDLDFTFCDRAGEPGFTMWLRNRSVVGQRLLTPRSPTRLVSP